MLPGLLSFIRILTPASSPFPRDTPPRIRRIEAFILERGFTVSSVLGFQRDSVSTPSSTQNQFEDGTMTITAKQCLVAGSACSELLYIDSTILTQVLLGSALPTQRLPFTRPLSLPDSLSYESCVEFQSISDIYMMLWRSLGLLGTLTITAKAQLPECVSFLISPHHL